MDPFPDAGPCRELRRKETPEPGARRLEVHHQQQPEIIKDGGNQRRLANLEIGNRQDVGDEKSGRPHDRGHDLAPGAGRGLHRPGEMGGVADPLHHGDRNHPGAINVGHRGPGDRPKHSAGEDGDLGRPSAESSRHAAAHVHQDGAGPRLLHDCAQDDEEHDISGGYPEGNAEDAVQAEHLVIDHIDQAESPVSEGPRHIRPGHGIGEKGRADQSQNNPHNAPRELEHQCDPEHADESIPGAQSIHQGLPDFDGFVAQGDRSEDDKGERSQAPIGPTGRFSILSPPAGERVPQETQDRDEGQMDGPLEQSTEGAEGGGI